MRNDIRRKPDRILAIAPSTRGFGFALLESGETLVDWGFKSVSGDKNAGTLKKVEWMIAHYQPGMLALQDTVAKGSRRSPRIRDLTKQLIATAAAGKTKVALISRDQIMRAFLEDGQGSKHTIARILALRFPKELGHRLPPKRRPWMSEDYRMCIFDAVALSFANKLLKKG